MERRRIYLMRHGAVAYFDRDGRPVAPDDVPLTAEGRRQAAAAAALLDGTPLDRVVSSDLPRAVETAAIVASRHDVEAWPELREIAGDRFSSIPPAELEREFVGALHGIVPNDKRFLGGETIGELFDRVLPAVDRLLGDATWDTALVVAHGAVNRAILSHALLGERVFLGRFEQAPGCLNVLDVGAGRPSEWIVRAVNIAPCDLAHRVTRLTQMEQYWREYVPRGDTGADGSANAERAGSLPPSRVVLDANQETGGA
jgi:broad specificity phosphatase PhoE